MINTYMTFTNSYFYSIENRFTFGLDEYPFKTPEITIKPEIYIRIKNSDISEYVLQIELRFTMIRFMQ